VYVAIFDLMVALLGYVKITPWAVPMFLG